MRPMISRYNRRKMIASPAGGFGLSCALASPASTRRSMSGLAGSAGAAGAATPGGTVAAGSKQQTAGVPRRASAAKRPREAGKRRKIMSDKRITGFGAPGFENNQFSRQ